MCPHFAIGINKKFNEIIAIKLMLQEIIFIFFNIILIMWFGIKIGLERKYLLVLFLRINLGFLFNFIDS